MSSGGEALSENEEMVLDGWSARKIQPVVLLYVTAVFAVFMAMAIVVFHSSKAVKALAIGWIGAIAATVPGVIEKVEYRLTDAGLGTRALHTKRPVPFKDVFHWNELDHVVPTRYGFKYSKHLDEPNPLRRFWKAHVSDQYSGEVHIERIDRDRILGIVGRQRDSTFTPG